MTRVFSFAILVIAANSGDDDGSSSSSSSSTVVALFHPLGSGERIKCSYIKVYILFECIPIAINCDFVLSFIVYAWNRIIWGVSCST